MQRLQAQVEIECVLRRLNCAKIAHKLHGCFCDVSSTLTKRLSIYKPMIRRIGLRQTRELVLMRHPIKRSAINNGTANSRSMTVHILCGGVNDNIGSPLNRTTIYRCRKRIINNQGDTVRMCSLCPTLNIKHHKRRIGNSLTKDALGRGSECRSNFFIGGIAGDAEGLIVVLIAHFC